MSTITVLGEASADVLPDRVEWTLNVEEIDTSRKAAFDRCTTRVGALAQALSAFEVTTGHIGFEPEWHANGHKKTGRLMAHAALLVAAPLDQAAAVAITAMDAGADEVHGPALQYPDARATRDALLPQAVEAARRNADAIAAAAGRRAGRVLSVTDPSAQMDPEGRHRVRFAAARAASGGDDGRDVPLIAAPRQVTAALIVVFELTD